MMRELKAMRGLSLRKLEAVAVRSGDCLPPSTLAAAMRRNELPRDELLAAFVRACGGTPDEVRRWRTARTRLAVRRVRALPSAPAPAPVPAPPVEPVEPIEPIGPVEPDTNADTNTHTHTMTATDVAGPPTPAGSSERGRLLLVAAGAVGLLLVGFRAARRRSTRLS